MSQGQTLPRGTALHSRPLRGVTCRFQTTAPAQVLPVRLSQARLQTTAAVPAGTAIPPTTTALLSLQFDLLSPQASFAGLGVSHLRLYLDGDPSLVTALRETLSDKAVALLYQTQAHGPWQGDRQARLAPVGFAEDEALVDFDQRSHPAYRLLTEYFAFADKFNFVDLPLPASACARPAAA
jgi:type VI secretion system protein ImpG